MSDESESVEEIELQLLLEGIHRRYGYDFRGYSAHGLQRRLAQALNDHGAKNYLELAGRAMREPDLFHALLPSFSVVYTSLFRDPKFYATLVEAVFPRLRSWPHAKIWHAGCATGEEVYSHAILLREAGLLERCMLYATDINQAALDTGKAGIYSLESIRRGTPNYLASGGAAALSDYYLARYQAAILEPGLRRRMTFARHNLAMDASFGEMQMILCRNVLIYFDEPLQNRVLELFWESLDTGGFLCLGDKESLTFSSVADRFEEVDVGSRIYKKRVQRQPT